MNVENLRFNEEASNCNCSTMTRIVCSKQVKVLFIKLKYLIFGFVRLPTRSLTTPEISVEGKTDK